MNSDRLLVGSLGGTGSVISEVTFYCVRKKGNLLLALPLDRKTALKSLGLYQPQSLIARAYTMLICCLTRIGLHRLWPKLKMEIRTDSPLSEMVRNNLSMGFLLGNPEARFRRAIVVYGDDGNYKVDKIGLNQGSASIVSKERKIIESFPQDLAGLFAIESSNEHDNWASYTTRLAEGCSPTKSDDRRVLRLLRDWDCRGEFVPLKEMSQWVAMETYAFEKNELKVWKLLSTAASLPVRQGVFHGDFAPWNIKLSKENNITVLDWETGCDAGPCGWDWLHYMIQRATLVDRMSANDTVESCRQWAASSAGMEMLRYVGWDTHVELWIGTYLAYSSWVAGFKRSELLEAWVVK